MWSALKVPKPLKTFYTNLMGIWVIKGIRDPRLFNFCSVMERVGG